MKQWFCLHTFSFSHFVIYIFIQIFSAKYHIVESNENATVISPKMSRIGISYAKMGEFIRFFSFVEGNKIEQAKKKKHCSDGGKTGGSIDDIWKEQFEQLWYVYEFKYVSNPFNGWRKNTSHQQIRSRFQLSKKPISIRFGFNTRNSDKMPCQSPSPTKNRCDALW